MFPRWADGCRGQERTGGVDIKNLGNERERPIERGRGKGRVDLCVGVSFSTWSPPLPSTTTTTSRLSVGASVYLVPAPLSLRPATICISFISPTIFTLRLSHLPTKLPWLLLHPSCPSPGRLEWSMAPSHPVKKTAKLSLCDARVIAHVSSWGKAFFFLRLQKTDEGYNNDPDIDETIGVQPLIGQRYSLSITRQTTQG